MRLRDPGLANLSRSADRSLAARAALPGDRASVEISGLTGIKGGPTQDDHGPAAALGRDIGQKIHKVAGCACMRVTDGTGRPATELILSLDRTSY